MYLVVGLGNPGKQYDQTRHNVGFRVLDLMTDDFGWETKYDSMFVKTDDVILAKPQTYMNLSGKAVAQILKYYPAAQLIVVQDELDFPLGSIKIMKNISAAGHNGIQSIIDELGTKDFIRVRIGTNNPDTRGQIPGEDYVLQKFTDKEEEILKPILLTAKVAIETIMTSGLEIAQSKYNG